MLRCATFIVVLVTLSLSVNGSRYALLTLWDSVT
nr:MAG TPA: hypothetical protein [Caudoviricetes sp.]